MNSKCGNRCGRRCKKNGLSIDHANLEGSTHKRLIAGRFFGVLLLDFPDSKTQNVFLRNGPASLLFVR